MHIGKCLLLAVVFLALPLLCAAQSEEFERTMDWELFSVDRSRKYLTPVTSFGYIVANRAHTGQDKRQGQTDDVSYIDEEMSRFLQLRFQNAFGKFPYKFVGAFGVGSDPQIARLQCDIWLHGESYPIAYHVECFLGAGKKWTVLQDATLGITSNERANGDIQMALDRMVSKFARIFFQARGAP